MICKNHSNAIFLITIVLICILPCCNQKQEKLFSNISNQTGINFSNTIIESEQLNILNFEYMYNGAGVAVGDVNKDGFTDIYFTEI